ncbi:MAG TPA: hypothetical protein VHY56_11340, partial [Candidatus Binataceae bacterium]|nr:hypothetical protein [Candidatus Binataceae bacterium]
MPSATPGAHHRRRHHRHNYEAPYEATPTPITITSTPEAPSYAATPVPSPSGGALKPSSTISGGPARFSIGGETGDQSGVEQRVEQIQNTLSKVDPAALNSNDR